LPASRRTQTGHGAIMENVQIDLIDIRALGNTADAPMAAGYDALYRDDLGEMGASIRMDSATALGEDDCRC
jgi:hypothetical protein